MTATPHPLDPLSTDEVSAAVAIIAGDDRFEVDAVFVHDAVAYMTTEADLRQVIETAFAHCRPGGIALFIPDHTAENFQPVTDHGGSDGPDGRGGTASRPSGWPVLRTPKWMLAAGAVLVAGLALAAVPHRPSTEQRAADLDLRQRNAAAAEHPLHAGAEVGREQPHHDRDAFRLIGHEQRRAEEHGNAVHGLSFPSAAFAIAAARVVA